MTRVRALAARWGACLALAVAALGCAGKSATPRAATDETWRARPPKPGATGHVKYPAVHASQLENGLAVLVVQTHSGLVSTELVVRHGASSVPRGKSGLAPITLRMMTEGTTERSSLELAGAAEDLGSSLGHEAGRDGASIGLTTLAEDFSRALDLIAEVATKPAFRAEELERVRAEWLEHLIAERQEPRRLGSLVGMRALFGDVRGASVTGSPRDVRSLSVEDLRSFHSRVFTPPNAALVVSGEIAPEQVQAAAERAFASWRGPAWAPATSSEPPALPDTPRVVLVPRRGAVQSAIFVAQPFPTRLEAGHEARELLATLFGGLFTSRINRNLREEHGFTYGASAGALAGRNLGAFLVSTMVETSVTAPALTEIQRELEGLRDPDRGEPIRAEELTRARSALIGGLAARLTTTADIATDLSSVFTLGLPLNYLEGYPALLTAIPADAVSREATRLSSKRIVVTIVGDPAVREPLVQAGFTVTDVEPAWLE